MESLTVLSLLLLLLLLRTPVYLSLFLAGALGISLFTDLDLVFAGQVLVKRLENPSLLAIPFLILLGAVCVRGRSAGLLVELARGAAARLPGSSAIGAVWGCLLFGAVSGSSISTAVIVREMMWPHLRRSNYPKKFSIGLLTSSSLLGVVVPPSIILLVCALTAGQPVKRVFAAGYLPALLIVSALSLYAWLVARRAKGIGAEPKCPAPAVTLTWEAVIPLFVILLLAGSLYSGFFTVSEAVAVCCLLTILVECLWFRVLRWRDLGGLMVSAGFISGALVITISGAGVFSEYLTIQGIPAKIFDFCESFVPNGVAFLVCANVLLLLAGSLLDAVGAVVVLVPVMVPVAVRFGVDPIHFCFVVTLSLGISQLLPPLGILLSSAAAIHDEDHGSVARTIGPSLAIYLGSLFLISFVPVLSTYVPNLLFG